MTLDYSAPAPEAAPPTQDLIPEARSRARRRHWVQAGSAVLVAAVAVATSLLVFDKAGPTASAAAKVSPAAWAKAKTTCNHQDLSSFGGTPHLYRAYPTTVRLAVNWPTKIYPISSRATTLTTIHAGTPATPGSSGGWPPGYNTSRPADICIFTGNFSFSPPSMQGSPGPVEHAKVLLVYLMDIPPMNVRHVSVTPLNSIPSRPVPVAVSTR